MGTQRIGLRRTTVVQTATNVLFPVYGFAEADLRNLWPAIGAINSSRGDKLFNEIRGGKPSLLRALPT